MKLACLSLLLVAASTGIVRGDGFVDDFSRPELKDRQALRGAWVFADKQAKCVADPKLYKEFKNHGPILRWPCDFRSGTIEFEFKPRQVQRLVFTFNDEGHVFRGTLGDSQRTRIFGWSGLSKDTKPETLVKQGVPLISQLEDQWIKAKVRIKGDTGEVTIGDFTAKLKHASLARRKREFTLSFAFGELTVRNVRLTTND